MREPSASVESFAANDRRAEDEAHRIALETRIVEQVLARLGDVIVEEVRRSLVPALREQLERRVREAVHEALREEFDQRP